LPMDTAVAQLRTTLGFLSSWWPNLCP
jgi:hypothetical protein